jgi:SpoVK/Ycf46/Vps4 family AAA+-type ATPase
VRTLFQLAKIRAPSVIFIDEIDSLLCSRSENENESSRRIKTEFLVQIDGARSSDTDQILLIGATNRPEEIDEAARRRLIKRLYISLPGSQARLHLINKAISNDTKQGGSKYQISQPEVQEIVERTKGYSAADMHNLMAETSLAPLREVDILTACADQLRPVNYKDFLESLRNVRICSGR